MSNFGLPEYDDLFLEMIFKVGINGDRENLIPIEHFHSKNKHKKLK